MSAFEISVTPSRLKQKKRAEGREPTEVVMAPFSAKAIVQFEDVPIGKNAKRILRVINPSDEGIEVKVTKAIKAEHNLNIEWVAHTVPAQDEVALALEWSPLMEVACKETLQLQDNRNFRKDVMIILKSKSNQVAKNTRKFPTVGKTLQLKSPTGGPKAHKSGTGNAAAQQKRRSSTAATNVKTTWRNTPAVRAQRSSTTAAAAAHAPFSERNVYLSNVKQTSAPFTSPDAHAHGCKENISPTTPSNVLSLIDKMKFTPIVESSKTPIRPDNLAAWPTPVIQVEPLELVADLRPRRLLVTDDDQPPVIVVNRTFEVRREPLDVSVDTLDYSRTEEHLHMQGSTGTLNRTTTINQVTHTRALECIREEDGSSSQLSFGMKPPAQVPCKEKVENLRRDVELVGSPLRKYSESMKDLSLLSVQTKLATQGSMPNLNEMAHIRSIEQNRYYLQQQQQHTYEVTPQQKQKQVQQPYLQAKKLPASLNSSTSSDASAASQNEFHFNQNEILAQSSHFNLNELGHKSHKKLVLHPTRDATLTNNPQKRRSHELSFSGCESPRKNGATGDPFDISPSKRQRMDMTPVNASAARIPKPWTPAQSKKVKLAHTLSLMKKPPTPRKAAERQMMQRVKLYDSELYMQSYINPDPFAATTTADPFLASTMYLDEEAVERHLEDFKKWLNALVSMPADFDADTNSKIDVGKLFNEVRNKDLVMAPTKEEQSMNYLTKYRLESLRRAAVELFFSEEMRVPCSKVAVYVNKQTMRIRSDRNLHLDVVMQRNILELLLCFNPLWLRLGLEVVFGEKLHMQSNRDIVGLSTFILNRLFRNKMEEQRYSKAYTLTEEYAEAIKKHTLLKVLFLLLFLDKAKQQRIVKHNPCLFVKKSPHKETKDILLRFSSELLANVGDITRDLRRLGYTLQHKQTFLDEFDYAFQNLAVDLRDGVRLTRVMEIILLREDLTKQLRVPAISRLQRIHNVKLALTALSQANFQLKGDICAADVVDGFREKTLSLLWQIIYKFRSPKFHAAAKILQNWWRRRWLHVSIARRIRYKQQLRRERAATLLQAIFRGHQTRKYVALYREQRVRAAIVLQKYTRRYLAQKHLYQSYNSIVLLQRRWRAKRLGCVQRVHFLRLRASAIFLQRIWRRRQLASKLLAAAATARLQRQQKLQAAAACIQMHWSSYKAGKAQRAIFLQQRQLIVRLQQRIRANCLMKQERQEFLRQRQAAVQLQTRWRARLEMKRMQQVYQQNKAMTVLLQRRWRAQLLMRRQRNSFLQLKKYTQLLQAKFRARREMRRQRTEFEQLRQAALAVQRRYRARQAMKKQLNDYQQRRRAAILIQQRWRAQLLMRQERQNYLRLRSSVQLLQSKYRAQRAMRKQLQCYQELTKVAIVLQRRWRSKLLARQVRGEFLALKRAALSVQRRRRAYKTMRFQRAKFQGSKAAVCCLQQHWRGYLLMRHQRADFLKLRAAAITLQRSYRQRCTMLSQKNSYQALRLAAITVQRRWRAQIRMRQQQQNYRIHRQLIVAVQRRWRAQLLMRRISQQFEHQRTAAIHLQRWLRGLRAMRHQRQHFEQLRASAIVVQVKWRATLQARQQRQHFLHTVQQVRCLQLRRRATLAMRIQQAAYTRQRAAAVLIQRSWRALVAMRQARAQYTHKRQLVIKLQQRYRAKRLGKQVRGEFVLLKRTVVHLQQKLRGRRLMLQQREHFQLLCRSTLEFQTQARGFLARRRFQALLTPEMMELLRQKRAAKVIQRYWRGYRTRKRQRHEGLKAIRQRVKMLRAEATVMNSVRCKVKESVRFLSGRFVASEALAVLNRLDRLSRTVPHLLMWCSEFMATFCYGIMAQAIRSEVDKQVIERCSRIILNLARYNSTTVNTFQESGLVTIAQMLLRWCDKDSEIFNTLCTLIWVFAHCPRKRRIIRNFMTTTDAIYMVRETKKLVARKEKMKQNVRKPLVATVAGGRRIQKPQQNFSPLALPSLEPDFGIIRYKPYTFISSVYAFDTILCKLGIEVF